MTVIFPGGEFLEFIKTVIKNKFLAGNIPVIKSSLLFFLCVGREREPIAVHLPCARSHSNASMLAAVLVDRFLNCNACNLIQANCFRFYFLLVTVIISAGMVPLLCF